MTEWPYAASERHLVCVMSDSSSESTVLSTESGPTTGQIEIAAAHSPHQKTLFLAIGNGKSHREATASYI